MIEKVIPAIREEEHCQLLYQLRNLSQRDGHAREPEKTLKDALAKYHELLGDLEATVSVYLRAVKKAKGL